MKVVITLSDPLPSATSVVPFDVTCKEMFGSSSVKPKISVMNEKIKSAKGFSIFFLKNELFSFVIFILMF